MVSYRLRKLSYMVSETRHKPSALNVCFSNNCIAWYFRKKKVWQLTSRKRRGNISHILILISWSLDSNPLLALHELWGLSLFRLERIGAQNLYWLRTVMLPKVARSLCTLKCYNDNWELCYEVYRQTFSFIVTNFSRRPWKSWSPLGLLKMCCGPVLKPWSTRYNYWSFEGEMFLFTQSCTIQFFKSSRIP